MGYIFGCLTKKLIFDLFFCLFVFLTWSVFECRFGNCQVLGPFFRATLYCKFVFFFEVWLIYVNLCQKSDLVYILNMYNTFKMVLGGNNVVSFPASFGCFSI